MERKYIDQMNYFLMKKFVVTLCLLAISFVSNSQHLDPKYESLFIYNFTKYFEWPSSASGDFVINILGEGDVVKELQKMASIKKIGDRSIKIVTCNDLSEIKSCHILFVTYKKSSDINDVLVKIKEYETLVITEKPGLGKLGAGVNFVNRGGKLKFELNKTACTSKGIKVSRKLEALAILL